MKVGKAKKRLVNEGRVFTAYITRETMGWRKISIERWMSNRKKK